VFAHRHSKKFKEDMGQPTKEEVKNLNFCYEYENLYRKSLMNYQEDITLEMPKKNSFTKTYAVKKSDPLEQLESEEIGFFLQKSLSINEEQYKPRANSILKMLENSMNFRKSEGSIDL
jgi:hypothetical protein